jgi:PfpI family intracellular protease
VASTGACYKAITVCSAAPRRAIEEMKHAERLIERIIFLGGTPAVKVGLIPKIGAKVQQLEYDLASEHHEVRLPGGALNADALRADQRAQEFIRRIDEAGKPIAVICHGSWLLVSAGLRKGRTFTSYHTIQDDIRNSGGQWVDREVVRDRNWISSRQPSDLPAFNREMIALFGAKKSKCA